MSVDAGLLVVSVVCMYVLQIKRKQDFVTSVLANRKIPFEEVDISDPLCASEKNFMREHSRPSGTDPAPLPPQIFNDTVYCGVTCLRFAVS